MSAKIDPEMLKTILRIIPTGVDKERKNYTDGKISISHEGSSHFIVNVIVDGEGVLVFQSKSCGDVLIREEGPWNDYIVNLWDTAECERAAECARKAAECKAKIAAREANLELAKAVFE